MKTIKYFLIVIASFIVAFLLFAFVKMDLNPLNWSETIRGFSVFSALFISAFSVWGYSIFIDDEND